MVGRGAGRAVLERCRGRSRPAGRWLVYCLVGWLLGQTITRDALGALRSNAVPVVVTVALFLVFGLVLAWCLWRFTDLDLHSALLSTAPGGIAQMGVLLGGGQGQRARWCWRSTCCG